MSVALLKDPGLLRSSSINSSGLSSVLRYLVTRRLLTRLAELIALSVLGETVSSGL